ncbi:MAG: carbon-nitrogen hydrolase family protein, partial [Treponema sp.]|nr:carbon-nitrogen hydrolase family protein [Treponema sp.]
FSLDISEKNIFPELVELSQPIVEKEYSSIAKKYSMYIIGCYLVKHDNLIYNAASIFDRNGKIIGEYRKTHLPANETWQISPGESIDVFELDFGKIGICICYDMMFPETVQILALKGAQIIFHPTFGYGWNDFIGEAALKVRANDNGVYIVTSKNYKYNAAGKSSIIDYWGNVLIDAGFEKDVIVTKEIDLDIIKEQPSWYFNSYMTDITNVTDRMRKERRPEIYSMICEQNEKLIVSDLEKKKIIIEAIKKGECRWQ